MYVCMIVVVCLVVLFSVCFPFGYIWPLWFLSVCSLLALNLLYAFLWVCLIRVGACVWFGWLCLRGFMSVALAGG